MHDPIIDKVVRAHEILEEGQDTIYCYFHQCESWSTNPGLCSSSSSSCPRLL
jgi:hypothetical protein